MGGEQIIYREEKVEFFRHAEDLILIYKEPHILRINSKDRQTIDSR